MKYVAGGLLAFSVTFAMGLMTAEWASRRPGRKILMVALGALIGGAIFGFITFPS